VIALFRGEAGTEFRSGGAMVVYFVLSKHALKRGDVVEFGWKSIMLDSVGEDWGLMMLSMDQFQKCLGSILS
jgi:hypothetical protein